MNPLPDLTTIQQALTHLLGSSPEGRAARQELENYRRRTDDILHGRADNALVIGVVGLKNAGKSWLCRSLLLRQEDREQIPSGVRPQDSTEKLCWIGPRSEAPESADEDQVHVERTAMQDLGRPYILLDVPGCSEADDQRRLRALRSVSLAPLRIILFSQETLQDTTCDDFLAEGNGASILPVISAPDVTESTLDKDIETLMIRLQERCPRSQIMPPVRILRLDAFKKGAAREKAENDAADTVHVALRDAVNTLQDNRQNMLDGQVEILRRHLSRHLKPVLDRLRQPLQQLHAAEAELQQAVFEKIVGSDEDLERSVRFRLLWQAAENLPRWMVPFRSLLHLQSFFGGRVDRLGLAMIGSAPSLALAAFDATRHVRGEAQRLTVLDHQLQQEVRSIVLARLQPAVKDFHTSLAFALPDLPARDIDAEAPPIRITGLETLRSRSKAIFRDEIRACATGKAIKALGLVATGAFWTLVAGPAAALYHGFYLAWRASLDGWAAEAWRAYPMPTPGFLFINFLLVLGPVFLLACLASLLSITKERLRRCTSAIQSAHQRLIRELVEDCSLGVARQHPEAEAVRTLDRFITPRATPVAQE